VREHDGADQPSTMSEKYSAGPNFSASSDSGVANGRDEDGGDGAREERRERRGGERCAGLPLARHLVTVEAGDGGRRLAGMLSRIDVVEPRIARRSRCLRA
jgi:hypothetical protein